jgi:deazaflavin-dependent oxidoreductase (nitroreductase family)
VDGKYVPSPRDFAAKQVELYERTGGREGDTIDGFTVVILTTRGVKTGDVRKTPIIRVERDGAYLAVASYAGRTYDPAWAHNLRATPEAELQDGPEAVPVTARELGVSERAAWWDRAVSVFPRYAQYESTAERVIPLFLLSPRQG